jgi:hypothetical protein
MVSEKKKTDSARGEDCTIRLPGVCNFKPETTVACHVSGVRFGHGTGIKTKFFAYGCSSCHDVVDGRRKRPDGMSKEAVQVAHLEGVLETMMKLQNKGLV